MKSENGNFVGILSDTSLDRDEEFMTKELLTSWASNDNSLPMLANHENKMEKFIGGWKNKKVVSKNGHNALTAEPFFFSKEACPLAAQIKKQVEEALDNGMAVGISIGAIPHEFIEKKCSDGKRRKGFSKGEIVEATIVPVQSNRNANFAAIAKGFDLEVNKEVINMAEEVVKNDSSELTKEAPVVEVVAKVAEVVVQAEPVVVEAVENKELSEAMKAIEILKAKIAELETKTVVANAPSMEVQTETPTAVVKDADWTIKGQVTNLMK